jgi:hypothetical protein
VPIDSYDALIDGIDEIVAAQKDLGTQARGRRLARSYWEIGNAIHTHQLANEGKSTYGERFFTRFSNDLNLDQSLVYNMLRFRRGMPILESIPKLSWTHYVQIISLKSRQQREFYERAAAESSWTVRELKEQIKGDLLGRLAGVAARDSGNASKRRSAGWISVPERDVDS